MVAILAIGDYVSVWYLAQFQRAQSCVIRFIRQLLFHWTIIRHL